MTTFKLSASLSGHDDDVRGVCFPDSDLVISASRDATVRSWRRSSSPASTYDASIIYQGSSFVNAVAFIPATTQYPDGLIASGGKDTLIELRHPHRNSEESAERVLIGHAGNVCALDVCTDAEVPYLLSGSWDASARLWPTNDWEKSVVLDGHEASVWAVLAFDAKTIITGCADKYIRVFSPNGKLLRSFLGSTDPIRALCKLPSSQNGPQFASGGNDAIIRLWNLQGQQLGNLNGHESFIYSLALTPSGELISSSEDRTARVWRDNRCVQTITHPAISVWAIAVCQKNGDIVTGASDKIIRIFTKSDERTASPEAIQAFEDSVKASSIPQQQVGQINKEQLPGPEFLQQRSGTKEGQVQMIREPNGNVSAHQWSSAANQWVNVGTVVDAVGSSGRKQEYLGQDYDYVFDVDIEEGKPPLKLPYNLSQNPYEVAQRFIASNELPVTYLDQVANFIITNTQGATIGQDSAAAPTPPSIVPQPRPKTLPQKDFLSITNANIKTITTKISQLNSQLIQSGEKHLSLNPSDEDTLQSFSIALDAAMKATSSSSEVDDSSLTPGIPLVSHIMTVWPPANRLPGLDLYRLLAAVSPSVAKDGSSFVQTLVSSGALAPDANPNNAMLAIRALANVFKHAAGRQAALTTFVDVRNILQPIVSTAGSSNRNVQIALATLNINHAVLLCSSSGDDLAAAGIGDEQEKELVEALLSDILTFAQIKGVIDSEVVYRLLVALGTVVASSRPASVDAAQSAKSHVLQGTDALLKNAKEPRIKAVGAEIKDVLER